ncbi:MAG: response regulator [Nitrospirae bacterium]|nr:response regulator [Nitrospirota bacterium]MBF0519356.1 response regulator [Nitrospirota bacterium]MBF0535215.1 response regulator [Nitrospirota bacterium]MBF0615305.1 response regulator [Nitrospirota bacterium]
MRILIAEDDFTSRTLLQHFLTPFGDVDVTVNGAEAVEAFMLAMDEGQAYDLICLDIMMPEMDGLKALKNIRDKEKAMGITPNDEVKIVMTTALDSAKDVLDAYYRGGCNDYLTKPIDTKKLQSLLRNYGFTTE